MKGYVYAAVIALAILTGKVWLHKIDRLTDANQQLTEQVEQAQEKITGYEKLARLLAEDLASERQGYTELQHVQAQLQQNLIAGLNHIKELERENTELREWSAQPLPDTARRLRQRPAISGAADYQKWLSSRSAVQPATGQPER